MDTPQVKGLAFRSVMASLAELRSAAEVDRTLARLPEVDAGTLRYRVVATGWYPLTLYRQLLGAVVAGGEGEMLIRQIGQEAIRRDMNLVYRTVLRLLSPTTVMGLSSKLFSGYYDTGKLTVEAEALGLRATWSGCTGFDRLMWVELIGSTETMLELSGGKHIRVHLAEGGRGSDDFMVLRVHWIT